MCIGKILPTEAFRLPLECFTVDILKFIQCFCELLKMDYIKCPQTYIHTSEVFKKYYEPVVKHF